MSHCEHRLTFEEVAAPPRHPKGDHSAVYTCRLCNGEQKMEVNHRKGLWFCHKEQRGGRLKNSPDLHDQSPVHTEPTRNSSQEIDELIHYTGLGSESHDFRMRYLRDERNIPHEIVRFRLNPHTGPEFDRVYFPVWHVIDRPPAYFVGRSIFPEHRPPYRHPCKQVMTVAGGKSFWGLHCWQGPHLTLVEGIFDACHVQNRLAIMGSSLTPSQVGILSKLSPSTITVMLDGDAEKQAVVMVRQLIKLSFELIYLVRLPYGQDPDSLRDGTRPYEDKKERIV